MRRLPKTSTKPSMAEPQWVVAAFTLDGSMSGWYTSRGTISCWSSKAQRFDDRSKAKAAAARQDKQWPSYGWVPERAPTTDYDCRNGWSLQSMPLDTHQTNLSSSAARTPTNDSEETEHMAVRKTPTKATKAETKRQPAKADKVKKAIAVKPVPKMRLRTTAAADEADNKPKRRKCLDGCGSLSTNFFLRGHIKSFTSKLRKVRAGDLKPEQAFGKDVARAMGPWLPLRNGGFKPTVISYAKLRELV
jgi:hypothetical protein